MIELSDELRRAISERPGEPIQILDTVTKKTFVLVQAEIYERATAQFGDELDPRVGMAIMNQIMAADDEDDPYLESYQPEAS